MFHFIAKIAKYVIFVFNFFMVIFALLMILFGLLPIVHGGYDSTYSKIAIAVGVIVFFVSFLGCCGAVRENSTLLTAHAVILLVLFIIQIVVAVLVAIAIGNGSLNTDTMDKSLDKIFHSTDHGNNDIFRGIEKWLECCGIHNSTDYTDNLLPLPGPCCGESEDVDDLTGYRTCTEGMEYKSGCADKMREYFEDNYRWISCIAIGFGVFEIFGAIFTFWTRNHLSIHD